MRIDIQKYRNNTCMECKKYDRGKFGKCQAEKEDIYRCARQKIFGFNDGSVVLVGDIYKDEENFLWEVIEDDGKYLLENMHILGRRKIEDIRFMEDTGANTLIDRQ